MTWQETIQFFSLCLPKPLGKAIAAEPSGQVREIRVRAGRPARILTCNGEQTISLTTTQEQVSSMAESLCEHALYARAEESRQGFVTLRGGHRMGLCGRVIVQGGSVRALREISSLCIRLAGQWTGTANVLMPHLTDSDGHANSLLVVGLPGTGKTTLLRDACRQLSDDGLRIAIADERSELAAVSRGVPQLDVGSNTDVLDGCSKEVGLRWPIRAMSPDVLVTDELGGMADAQAVLEAAQSGVAVMASVHGSGMESLTGRSSLYHLMRNHVFQVYVVMDTVHPGNIATIHDEQRDHVPWGGSA